MSNKNKTDSKPKQTQTDIINSARKEILEWIKAGIVTIILFLFINIFISTNQVEGLSMYPTLNHKDLLFVSRLAYKDVLPDYEDIIIFDCEQRGYKLIKRVIGLPGDHIEIKNNEVYRNGVKLNESKYLSDSVITEGNIDEIIKPNHLFVMGDNRENSADSRYPEIGQVDMNTVGGEVLVRVAPNPKIFLNNN